MTEKKGMSRRKARRIARECLVRCIEEHAAATVAAYEKGYALEGAVLSDFASNAARKHFEAAARAAEALAALR